MKWGVRCNIIGSGEDWDKLDSIVSLKGRGFLDLVGYCFIGKFRYSFIRLFDFF